MATEANVTAEAELTGSAQSVVPASRRERLAAVSLSLVGFLTFYILSAGPVSGLVRLVKIPVIETVFSVIYAPLVFIVKRDLQPFSTILKAYAELFR